MFNQRRAAEIYLSSNTFRLPEHCIEYVKVIQWEKENPFSVSLDGDDPQHLSWVYEKAQDRANHFHITGLTYRLVQGVLKNIIPAVASTNAVIASVCATEVKFAISSSYSFRLVTFVQLFLRCSKSLQVATNL